MNESNFYFKYNNNIKIYNFLNFIKKSPIHTNKFGQFFTDIRSNEIVKYLVTSPNDE